MKKEFFGLEKSDIINFMRRAGYLCLGRGSDEAEFSFVRSFGRSGYPRFHLFIRFDKGKDAIFNLHIDQKKPVYAGSRAHAAEYEGPLIEEEMRRIESLYDKKS
ncbi:MAG: hypothetical protein WBK67_03950 [Minisyncoccales bacterium]|jgi:hypothetical protein